ncbi:helix-turn-helix transcriptional regulator [Brachybacterium endophyticum]|uniref:helix-turn-helix transcriptional regulator n=1 Tax=Brachybacterium endophyticum TaxID=2182385 RepID=UPI001F0C4CCB|nr:helix-turn-helix transcriptional regulator [Brachybacterium endophyticum]
MSSPTSPTDDPRAQARWASVLALARSEAAVLGVEDLADHAGYSPFHFSRLFTARYGLGPGRYLTALRIDAAKRMLLGDDAAVIDVATEVGFDSLSSFSRRFRDSVGVPPGALRRLADRVADVPPRPFALSPDAPAHQVSVHLELPAAFSSRGDASVWVGWYPHPAPIGLPRAGVLARGERTLHLPLCPGAPFLLGFAVPAQASVEEHLIPADPVVAVHPAAVVPGDAVVLRFAPQGAMSPVPLLSALPVLCGSGA